MYDGNSDPCGLRSYQRDIHIIDKVDLNISVSLTFVSGSGIGSFSITCILLVPVRLLVEHTLAIHNVADLKPETYAPFPDIHLVHLQW